MVLKRKGWRKFHNNQVHWQHQWCNWEWKHIYTSLFPPIFSDLICYSFSVIILLLLLCFCSILTLTLSHLIQSLNWTEAAPYTEVWVSQSRELYVTCGERDANQSQHVSVRWNGAKRWHSELAGTGSGRGWNSARLIDCVFPTVSQAGKECGSHPGVSVSWAERLKIAVCVHVLPQI